MEQKITQLHNISPEQFKADILEGVGMIIKELTTDFEPKKPLEYMTRKEVAHLLRVSIPTVIEWDKKGVLNPRRIGNQVRYVRTEVEHTLTEMYPESVNSGTNGRGNGQFKDSSHD